MAHVLLSTTNSMSLDTLQSDKLGGTDDLSSIIYGIYSYASKDEKGFTDATNWAKVDVKACDSPEFTQIIRKRFIAYLADGDEDGADAILKRYHIVGGINGLDFSESYIASGNLHISVKYTLEYEFNMFNLGTMSFEQSACSKLWK